MARLFDVVRELSGQAAAISIPRPYIKFCEGNHTHAAVLSQLVFWSSTKADGEWFYKSNDELGTELCLTTDQVRYAVRQLKKRLGDVIQSRVKKANGVPTTHYQINGDRLVELLFPATEQDSQMDSVILPDGNGNITESNREDYQNHGSGNITDSSNRSKPYTNKQIPNAPSKLDADERQPVFQLVLNDKSLFPLYAEDVQALAGLYPAVDVHQQFRNMIGWLAANPRRRKTKSGIERFINSWLAKEQDRGYAVPAAAQPASKPKPDQRTQLKNKIRDLELEINNENQALLRAIDWGATQDSIDSSKRRIAEMSRQRQQLLDELGGRNGQ
ncbi:ATPase [Photobacterium sp. MCCC 1A19761]|uniref:ATPase n=1 Tax=Photobacterium sp. MCCC 1A19761 TaxID=3115000 RepID=UPI00307E2D3E